mmetsp:Transcript_8415/g.25964  ORF Transcript_8415/g.25964 Transcript_8415/m.25964 type:complete len:213 (+) Transcript_8415:255-893(+)
MGLAGSRRGRRRRLVAVVRRLLRGPLPLGPGRRVPPPGPPQKESRRPSPLIRRRTLRADHTGPQRPRTRRPPRLAHLHPLRPRRPLAPRATTQTSKLAASVSSDVFVVGRPRSHEIRLARDDLRAPTHRPASLRRGPRSLHLRRQRPSSRRERRRPPRTPTLRPRAVGLPLLLPRLPLLLDPTHPLLPHAPQSSQRDRPRLLGLSLLRRLSG